MQRGFMRRLDRVARGGEIRLADGELDDVHALSTQLAGADRHLHAGGDLDPAEPIGECRHQCSPSQNCWMRVQASRSSSVALA